MLGEDKKCVTLLGRSENKLEPTSVDPWIEEFALEGKVSP